MEGFKTGLNYTILPYFQDGELKGLMRNDKNQFVKFDMDGKTVIPDTDDIPNPKIKYTQYLPNESILKDTDQRVLNTLNVSEVSEKIEEVLRRYLTLKDEEYAVVVSYVISCWTPDCYSSIPHLLLSCPNSPGVAQFCIDLLTELVPAGDGTNRAKDMVDNASFGLTLTGRLETAEKWEQTILNGGLKKGKPITVKNRRADVFSPRILTRTTYYRYDYCYEISVLRANADDYYSSLVVGRELKDIRRMLCLTRLKTAIELKNKSSRRLSELDVLNQFTSVPESKINKYKFILLPALLYNSSYLTPIKKFMMTETPVDTEIDLIICEAVQKIIDRDANDGVKGWYVDRRLVQELVEDKVADVGFEFDFPSDLNKMIGIVMISMKFTPWKNTPGGATHWVNKKLLKIHLDALKNKIN